MSSPSNSNIPVAPRQSTSTNQPSVSSPIIKSAANNPDKIRPISKAATRPIGVVSVSSPSKSSTTTTNMNDVPQIEINSPSPNSPGLTTSNKSKSIARDPYESQPQIQQQPQRFGYDSYVKQNDESISQIKSPSMQRKGTKTSTTISPVKQREPSETKRATATPINGNPTMSKVKTSSPRHASTSSEEQHIAAPTPMKSVAMREQPAVPVAPVTNNHLFDKTNQPSRLFIALFDYDPNAMSPNKDNEEELPFKEGQLIRVGIYSLSLYNRIDH